MDILEVSTATEEIDMEDLVTEDHSSPGDPLVNLTKAPIPNVPESQVDKYQKLHVLVAKLFTIFTRTYSGSYAISWLECRQANVFDAKTVILY